MPRLRSCAPGLAELALACASAPVTPLLDDLDSVAQVDEVRPRWPAPPAAAHVVYLGSIETRHSFEPRPSFWRRAVALLKGDEGGLRFVRPAGLCVFGSTLAVADPGAGVVHLLDLERRSWQAWSETAAGPLRSPVGVACLPDGRLVVSDSKLEALFAYDPLEKRDQPFVEGPLRRPTGLAYDAVHERVWLTETLEHRVRAFDLAGRELLRVGARGAATGRFNFPTRIAADAQGGAWLTDSLNFRLHHVASDGSLDHHFGVAGDRTGTFARPRGLAVDAAGRILVVDALMDAVQIFDEQGRLLLAFGGRGSRPGQLWLPSGIALDDEGHLFVADSYNRRVQIFAYRPPREN